MKAWRDVVSTDSSSMDQMSVDVIQRLSSNAKIVVRASVLLLAVTELVIVKIEVMTIMKNVVSKDSRNTIPNVADVLRVNGSVKMVIVLLNLESVTVKLNALINLMKVTRDVASRNSHSITPESADVIQSLNGLAVMDSVLLKTDTVMAKLNAQMDLMKVKMIVASRASNSTTPKSVAVTLRLNGLAPTANVSVTITTVMVNINVQISLMKTWNNAASISSNNMITKSVAATQTVSGLVLMALVFLSKMFAMEKLNAEISLMKRKLTAASKTFHSITVKSVAATLKLKLHVLMANVSRMIKSVMVLLIV